MKSRKKFQFTDEKYENEEEEKKTIFIHPLDISKAILFDLSRFLMKFDINERINVMKA
jgi:hypothetical protein